MFNKMSNITLSKFSDIEKFCRDNGCIFQSYEKTEYNLHLRCLMETCIENSIEIHNLRKSLLRLGVYDQNKVDQIKKKRFDNNKVGIPFRYIIECNAQKARHFERPVLYLNISSWIDSGNIVLNDLSTKIDKINFNLTYDEKYEIYKNLCQLNFSSVERRVSDEEFKRIVKGITSCLRRMPPNFNQIRIDEKIISYFNIEKIIYEHLEFVNLIFGHLNSEERDENPPLIGEIIFDHFCFLHFEKLFSPSISVDLKYIKRICDLIDLEFAKRWQSSEI